LGTLILGNYLLSENAEMQRNWGVAVEDNRIKAVGSNDSLLKQYAHYKLHDCRDKIVAPGLINSHLHTYSILGRGIPFPPGLKNFSDFLTHFWWPKVEDRIDSVMIESSTLATAVELMNSGVTTFCDVLEAPKSIPGALDRQAEILEETGIRAVLSIEASERLGNSHGLRLLDENENFFRNSASHPLISGMMCTHTTFTCSKDFLQNAARRARAAGSPIQMHLSESVYEPAVCMERYNMLPAELYREIGFWGEDVLAAQGVKCTEKELDILASSAVSLSHVPLSNCGFGGGIAPVPEMISKGLTVGLGTDGYINDFFGVMRGAFLIHKGHLENTSALPGGQVFLMATEHGAEAVKIPGIGKLKDGYFADIITINTELPTPVTEHNIWDQIILHRGPDDVSDVYIHGTLVKESGKMKKYDLGEINRKVREDAERLWRF
jgi:5-methylthioadenosine/S-adenosylhomocysteine deaminase